MFFWIKGIYTFQIILQMKFPDLIEYKEVK